MPTKKARTVIDADGTVDGILVHVMGVTVLFGAGRVLLIFVPVCNTRFNVIIDSATLEAFQASLDLVIRR